jgi:hypothetical protein
MLAEVWDEGEMEKKRGKMEKQMGRLLQHGLGQMREMCNQQSIQLSRQKENTKMTTTAQHHQSSNPDIVAPVVQIIIAPHPGSPSLLRVLAL